MTDYPPEMFPPRAVIGPNGVTVPNDLLDEWRGTIIPGPQEYVRADIFAALQAEVARLRSATSRGSSDEG